MNYNDYENLILASQDSEADDCHTCPYRGTTCRSQCMAIEEHYNPNLPRITMREEIKTRAQSLDSSTTKKRR